MKVLLINTYDSGGAAKACMRLHEGLLKQGVSSKLLILFSKNNYPTESNIAVFGKEFPYKYRKPGILEKIAIKAGKGKQTERIRREIEDLIPMPLETFSEPYSSYDITMHPWYKETDIIHFHWVSGFLDYSFFIKNKKPVVWTLHDMNPFTGGCHYSGGCKKFTNSCDYCHYLKTTSSPTYTNKLLDYKKENTSSIPQLKIVSPSHWLTQESQNSSLFKQLDHFTIPNGIDSGVFKPFSKAEARKILSLPLDKKILLFVAERIENIRKGNEFISNTLEALKNNKDVVMCSVGESFSTTHYENLIPFGKIQDERKLAMIYSAANVLLVPSTEDNLPNTPLESILCGTPVIAFPIGGLPDIITNGENGYLCDNISSDELLNKVNLFLQKGVQHLSNEIRESGVKKYDISVSAKRYIDLYQEVLKGN